MKAWRIPLLLIRICLKPCPIGTTSIEPQMDRVIGFVILDCNSYLAFFLFDFLLYWSGDGVNCKGKVTHLYICLEIIGNMLILTTLSKSKALQTRSGGCWKNCSTDTQQDSLTNNCICIPQKYLMQLYIIIHKSKSILRVSGCIPVPMKVSKKLNIKKTSITSLYHLSFY